MPKVCDDSRTHLRQGVGNPLHPLRLTLVVNGSSLSGNKYTHELVTKCALEGIFIAYAIECSTQQHT